MPRPWIETVSDWDQLISTRAYRVRTLSVRKVKKPRVLDLVLECLDEDQRGRRLRFTLPLPCRPSGPTASFFVACGQRVALDARLRPEDCAGKIINVKIAHDDTEEIVPESFEAIPVEDRHGQHITIKHTETCPDQPIRNSGDDR